MYKFGIALATLSLFATGVSAATVVDVDNLLVPAEPGGIATGLGALSVHLPTSVRTVEALQTWTVGKTGTLAQIDLFGSAVANYSTDGMSDIVQSHDFDVTLTVLGGGQTYAPGTEVLGSITKSAADIVHNGVTAFDFRDLDIGVAAGTVLTWRMSVDGCPEPPPYCIRGWSNWADFSQSGGGSTNGYAGGHMFSVHDGTLYYFFGQDLNFRTWVSEVPEPSVWALMIGGFGLTGAALRRRRPMAPA